MKKQITFLPEIFLELKNYTSKNIFEIVNF